MEKGTFGKLRAAIRDIANEKAKAELKPAPLKRHYRQAIQHFRELKEHDPELAGHHVELHATIDSLKRKMGPDLWSMYERVGNEKWETVQKSAIEDLVANVDKAPGDVEFQIFVERIFRDALKAADAAIVTDPAIVAAFKGREDLLNEANRVGGQKMLQIFLHMIEETIEDTE